MLIARFLDSDTSCTARNATLFYICQHPLVLRRLQKELSKTFASAKDIEPHFAENRQAGPGCISAFFGMPQTLYCKTPGFWGGFLWSGEDLLHVSCKACRGQWPAAQEAARNGGPNHLGAACCIHTFGRTFCEAQVEFATLP